MNNSTNVQRRSRLLRRAGTAMVVLALLGLGLSCIKQQDEVLVKPKDPETTQKSDPQK